MTYLCMSQNQYVKQSGSAHVSQVNCSLNSKLSDIKKRFFKENVTDIQACEQRAILSGRVLKDESLLGDNLLHTKTNNRSKKTTSICTINLTKTINKRRDIDIILELPNSRTIRFSFPCGEALYYAKVILLKQFGVPNDIPYNFKHSNGTMLTDCDTLLDHGIISSTTTSVTLTIQASQPPPSLLSSLAELVLDADDLAEMNRDCGLSLSNRDTSHQTSHFHSHAQSESDTSKKKSGTKSLFKGMKKGFLSGPTAKSSVTVKHPAAAAAKAAATKDIWDYDQIPTEAELMAKSQGKGDSGNMNLKKLCENGQPSSRRPVRYAHQKHQHEQREHKHQQKVAMEEMKSTQSPSIKQSHLHSDVEASHDNLLPHPTVPLKPTPAAAKPLLEPTFNIRYKQSTGEIVKQYRPEACTHLVMKIHFPHSAMKDLDLDVTLNKIKAASKFHQLTASLPVEVQHRKSKAKFDSKREILTITLPILILNESPTV